jgi:hypothetical protein
MKSSIVGLYGKEQEIPMTKKGLKAGVNWQRALKQKGVKQTSVK